ncbi:MAG: dihydrofolate reductase [Xanthomonadales bacterium]|jgi:dihydrofolate reductase|nr:dihydrofolate reductase [Xanthomonadales bacterium]
MLRGKVITIIAAMGRNRAIGMNGQLPWHLPRELRHFKEATMGKPIVMGRRTWQSIGRALPGRQNLVITRDPGFRADGCDVVHSLDRAIARAVGAEVMIIGGGQLYREAISHADRMILTLVHCEPAADTWFPEWDERTWRRLAVRMEQADEQNAFDYEVIELTRQPVVDETSPAPGTPGGPPA